MNAFVRASDPIVRPPDRPLRVPPRYSTLSYQSMVSIAAGVDATALVLASVLGSIGYHFLSDRSIAYNGTAGVGVMASIMFVLLARSRGLYELQAVLVPARHLKNFVTTLAVVLLVSVCVLFLLKVGENYSRGSMIAFATLAFVLVPGGRLLGARVSSFCIQRGTIGGRRVVTVGTASELEKLGPSDFFQFGVDEIARVALTPGDRGVGLGERARVQIAHAIELARELRAAEFMLIVPWNRQQVLADVSELLRSSPLPVKLFPDHTIRTIVGNQSGLAFSPYIAVEIQREPLARWERATKRMLDLLLATTAMIVLSPFLAIVALAIKLDSPGPVIFRQRRCGFDNREFMILKFRTMTVLDDGDGVVVQATRGDARITRIGRVLRRSSVDELPQLVNVIRDDMSLVGPRPHATAHDKKYKDRISSYALRHHVKPGLTGAAQVVGLRGETLSLSQMERRVQEDLWYINNWSLTLDLKIMVRTVFALLRHDAY
jgi:putative colanic acid biosysnthesis UDP-glucose lipid carrier transferase